MKICMLLKREYYQLSKDSRVLKTVNSLVDSGHELTIVLYKTQFKDHSQTVAIPLSKNVEIKSVEIPNFYIYNPVNNSKRNCKIIEGIKYFLREFLYTSMTINELINDKFDLYYCNDYETLGVGYYLSKIRGNGYIYDSHELWIENRTLNGWGDIVKPYIKVKEEKYIKNSIKTIAVSKGIKRYLCDMYQLDDDKVEIVRNIPDTTYIVNSDNILLYEKLGIPLNKKIVIYIGGLFTGRGIENTLRSTEYFDDDLILVFMGYGTLKDYIINYITRNGLGDKIKIMDPVGSKEVVKYASSAFLGIVAAENICKSYYYSLPNKLWEYIKSGIPVVGSDFPDLRDVINGENIGELIDPENPKSISSAINKLNKNKELYEFYKNNIVELSKNVSWSMEYKKIIDLMGDIDNKIRGMINV